MSTNELRPTYGRAPSERMKEILSPNGFLAPLVELSQSKVQGLRLDVHLRGHDEVHVYCGLTRILKVRRNRNGTVTVSAHQAYSSQGCAKAILRQWSGSEVEEFRESLDHYIREVQVHTRYTDQEGRIQAVWAGISEPWTPFDREAVLEYKTKAESIKAREFQPVGQARSESRVRAHRGRRRSRR